MAVTDMAVIYSSKASISKVAFCIPLILSGKYSNQHQRAPVVQSPLLLNVNSSCLFYEILPLTLAVCFCEYLSYLSKYSIWSWIYEALSLCFSFNLWMSSPVLDFSLPAHQKKNDQNAVENSQNSTYNSWKSIRNVNNTRLWNILNFITITHKL